MGLQMVEHVSKFELELIQKLRIKVVDLSLSSELLQDKNLVRWIRARKGNVEAAEQMLRKSFKWRLDSIIDGICSEKFPDSWGKTDFPWFASGVGYNNNLVACVNTGEWDIKTAISLGQKEELFRFTVTALEFVVKACVHLSKEKPWMAQLIAIHDYNGLSLSQVSCYKSMQFLLQLARVFDDNYPEILGKLFVVNAPWAFQLLYKALRPVFDERTLSKIVIVGYDKSIMREEIGKVAPFSEFPKMYGGDKDNDAKMTIGLDGSFQNLQL